MLDVKGRNLFELSRIGDPFVNFIYSLALSKAFKRPVGKKVSNLILSEALTRSKIREKVGSRMKRGDLGDYAEGLIFKAWIEGKMTIDEAVTILSKNLGPESKGTELQEESIAAFEDLLKHAVKACQM